MDTPANESELGDAFDDALEASASSATPPTVIQIKFATLGVASTAFY